MQISRTGSFPTSNPYASPALTCVCPDDVRRVWPLVASRLQLAVRRTGLSAFADIERDVLAGRSLLWLALSSAIAIDAVATTSLQLTDAGKVCVITACEGKGMTRWLPLIASIEAYAKAEGCKCVRIFGRKGWLRALEGYRQRFVIIDKAID
ncbi:MULTISPECIES: hypothetical protein [unclassified Bradyrhizobium]|uniref:hypothetical protein n=1 Tax=unclassified Bradyrhizobium TaxID=2631580 RepID=UPI0029161553|nr:MULTISPECIES: hypothetical protein [unclassified Bradyrhizobium]